MVKNLISLLVAIAVLAGLGAAERIYLDRAFTDVQTQLSALYDKTIDRTATEEDGMALQALWNKEKRALHIFIPHADIREMDLWISESVYYLAGRDFKEARAKLEVLIDYAATVPHNYRFKIENLL